MRSERLQAAHERERLRVAVIAPPWFEVPPSGYGGIESVVAGLVDQLTRLGHEVTLIGAGCHRTRAARFSASYPQPPSARLGTPLPEVVHAAHAAAVLRRLDVDIVHDHTLAGPLLAPGRNVPTIVTVHGTPDGDLGDYYTALGDSVGVVAISSAQRNQNPRLNWVATVHNAIDVGSFPFRERKDGYVLWLGRFCPEKGAHLAIEAARAAGITILLAGKLGEPAERAYFDQEVRPRLGPDISYVGEASASGKRVLLAGARALVFPIQWEEPFGMVMIEAMACGTPVVALRRGSVPEIVTHGVTGLIISHPAELPAALSAAASLNPHHCRAQAEKHFSLERMAADYNHVYWNRFLLRSRVPNIRSTA
jgi:glycosyltransferase involved in cell wall biosynthesis